MISLKNQYLNKMNKIPNRPKTCTDCMTVSWNQDAIKNKLMLKMRCTTDISWI